MLKQTEMPNLPQNILFKVHSWVSKAHEAQFTCRPLERPSPPLSGVQNGDLERGGVEEEEEGGSVCY